MPARCSALFRAMLFQARIQDFPKVAHQLPGGGGGCANLLFCQNFCRKLHENEITWTERGRVPGVPLDPPLFSTHSYTGDKNVDLRITLKFVSVKRLHLQVAIVRQLVFFSYRPSRC